MLLSFLMLAVWLIPARGGIIEYGNENLLGTGTYATDPKAGATLWGLSPGVVKVATNSFGHTFPFSPGPGDFAGTDQIYVGSVQTGAHDGYSAAAERINGPQVITMDYSGLVPAGQSVATLTLGIASDDFQFPAIGQPFTAKINGVVDTAITNTLNSVNEGGPVEQFFTVGIGTAGLLSSHVLTLSIDEGGDGGDGWAVDFLTIGVTTSAVPEPSSFFLLSAGFGGALLAAVRAARRSVGTGRTIAVPGSTSVTS
jgi:hypothetical protein